MVTTVNVTGYVKLPDNSEASGAVVTFQLSASDYDTAGDTAIPKSTTTVALGTGGALTAALWPNDRGAVGTRYTVDVIWTGSNGRPVTARLGSIQPVSSGSNDIADLLAAGGAGFDGVVISYLTEEQYDEVANTFVSAEQMTAAIAAAEGAQAASEVAQTASEAARDDAQASEAAALGAQAVAEAARDNATINADVYSDIATGRAAVADGEQFTVAASDGLTLVRYRRDSASTQTTVATYPAAGWLREQYNRKNTELVTGTYVEDFAFFDTSTQTATNITDAATPSYTTAKVVDGLQIALSTNARDIVFSTKAVLGPNKTRITYSGAISTGTTGSCGISVYDGVSRTSFKFQANIGRLIVEGTADQTGIIADGMGPLTATATVTMDFIFDAATNSATMFMSFNGGAPYSFKFTGIAIGDVYLLQRNLSTVTHSMDIAAVGEFSRASLSSIIPEITQLDRNALNAAIGLMASMQRQEPVGWDYDLPSGYAFYQNSGAYWSNIDLRPILSEDDPEVMLVHVDISTGSDSNSGASDAPLKSLHAALSRAGSGGKVIVKAMGGLYPYANAFRTYLPSGTIQIVSWDGEPIVSSMHLDTLTWTLDTGTTYTSTLPAGGVSTVFDASALTADGDYSAVELAASLSECRSTPGTWFSSGLTVYVHLSDGRAPDADLRLYVREVGGSTDLYGIRQASDISTLYMEDVHLEGGDSPYSTRASTGDWRINCYAKRCTVKYGAQNGTNISSDGVQVWQECIAAWNGDDGFNYKGSSFGGQSCIGIEIGCIGRWNGRDTNGTNNGSTQHGGPVIRVNGLYHDNQDRNVHDIDALGVQTLSWNLGCTSRNSRTGDANFAAGIVGGTDTTIMWLDGCVSSDGPIDVQANAASTVYKSGFSGGGADSTNDSGTIAAYTA